MHRFFVLSIGCAALIEVFQVPAWGACTDSNPMTNASVTCSGSVASPVLAQTASTGVDVSINPGATASLLRPASPVGFSVDTNSTITNTGTISLAGGGGSGGNRGAALLANGNGNLLLNVAPGGIATTGAFNDGMAANGSGNELRNQGSISTAGPNAYGMTAAWGQINFGQANNTLINTGTVTTTGTNARAMSILGGNGRIQNTGSISTSGGNSPTAYLQGNGDSLINSGSIIATGAASDAVFSNTAGSGFTATIENQAGGSIFSQNAAAVRTLNGASTVINAGRLESGVGLAVSMGTGVNTLILQTGSQIIGTADGGGGTSASTVVLQGTGVASNAFTEFETLRMEGSAWTFSGTGNFNTVQVQSGLLDLTGNFGAATVANIDPAGTLQATAQNLPGTVADNGALHFAQSADGAYTGAISGTGLVQKLGAGTLTLAPTGSSGNTYSGGTSIDQGAVAVGADNALGAATGGLAFNGGTLQLNRSFDLAATRAMALDAAGGTIDTQGNHSTLAQGISGAGGLTKLGAGALTLDGASTYGGGTTIAAGTLIVGDPAHAAASIGSAIDGNVSVAAGATLAGYGSVMGNVMNNGTLAVANALPAFASSAGGMFTVTGRVQNSGLIQVAGPGVGNTLLVAGDYVGQNGRIALNTQVGADQSPTDKLVIQGGQASGASTLAVTNLGGRGAATTGNGIEVVAATNGATTVPGAFSLAAPVNAGAYTYYLARGGVTDGSSQGWYLRNNVAPLPDPSSPSGAQIAQPVAAPGSPALPAATFSPTPLYRPEVALYSAIPRVVRQIGTAQLDNFHDRQGDQDALDGAGKLPASWARTWGGTEVLGQRNEIDPTFRGSIFGAQVGQDLYADHRASGDRNHYGVFFGYARAGGDVDGFSGGFQGVNVGRLSVNDYSLGAYWTHIASSGWYTDTVLSGSALTIDPASRAGQAYSTHGRSVAASVETGLPVALNDTFKVEPQAQLIWQHVSIDDIDDPASQVSFNKGSTYLGRVGVRLFADVNRAGVAWQPYVRLNLLRAFGSADNTDFQGSASFANAVGQTAGQIGAGVTAHINRHSSVYVSASYLDNLGGAEQRSVAGNVGVRWTW